MIDADGKLIGVRGDFGRGGIGARAIRPLEFIWQRIPRENGSDCGTDGNGEGIAGISGGVDSLAFGGGGDGEDLGGAENLAETLILSEEKSAVPAVINVWKDNGATNGEPKFIARKRRDAARILDAGVIEEIAGVESGVADKFKHTAVELICAGFGDYVAEACGAMADFRGHDARTCLHFLNSVHVEIGKGCAAEFRVGGIRVVHGEDGGDAALSVDGELLSEIGRAVGVGHGAGGEEEELAEVPGVER